MTQTTLALDPALTTGWAHTLHSGGIVTMPDGSTGKRLAYFADWLDMTLNKLTTDRIVYERAHHRGGASTRLALGWQSEIERLGYCHECEVISVHTGTLKKHATGNGHAKKFEMLAAAEAMHPTIEIVDHNHVDALFLLHWANAEDTSDA